LSDAATTKSGARSPWNGCRAMFLWQPVAGKISGAADPID
jgi:hypothetical protein